ncbi:MAG: cupin domain-containing protein [Novosphingobium sp.]|nr:cupin domain-containing protein [Novosphingobium sp.]
MDPKKEMADPVTESPTMCWTPVAMEARIVRYADLAPCYNAFIDCRTPGSEAKENFTIIGPGVSENPAQHVHIAEPHGFNIGGARQPPGCVNSQHSHDTAEVFVVHSGSWRFDLGEHGEDAQVELHPGDVISLPVKIFRGFTNIGDDVGFLWAVLGQDDPGHVTWAPKVFEMARDYGLVLLENGQLVDTAAGEAIPAGAQLMRPTSVDDVAKMKRANNSEADRMVVRAGLAPHGTVATPIIGPDGPLDWPHGFTLERLDIAASDRIAASASSSAVVIFVHRGPLAVDWDGGETTLGDGDTMTVPVGLTHFYRADRDTIAFIVRGAQ